jgi:hypothetical protein
MSIKFTSPYGWDFEQPAAVMLKMGSRGLIGNDRADFVKRASHLFLPQIDNLKLASDEVPVHLIALGSTEFYGPNRNGDGFKVATCRDRHDTFTKYAKFFRNHKNKPADGDPHYGQVKLSAYNEDMGRIELLAVLNGSKRAAAENKGLVADVELEKLANGEDISVSMACVVPFDICSCCGNKAATRNEYCTGSTCKAGGCSEKLAQLVNVDGELHHLHVDNPTPKWFDISRVYRPADRIAYGAKADYLTKSATADNFVAVQADVVKAAYSTAPLEVLLYSDKKHEEWSEVEITQLKLAYALSKLEMQLDTNPDRYVGIAPDSQHITKVAAVYNKQPESTLAALADRAIILSLSDYAVLTGQSEQVKSAARLLPRIYTYGLESEKLLHSIKQAGCRLIDALPSAAGKSLAVSVSPSLSLEKQAVDDRTTRAVIRNLPTPQLSQWSTAELSSPSATKLAFDYAVYKLQSLYRIANFDANFPLTATRSLRQNRLH